MEADVLPFIIGSVILLFFVTISVQMQISTIQGMNDVTVETSERIGYKAAGGLHMLKNEEFGVMSSGEFEQMGSPTGSGCTADLPGFGPEQTLRYGDEGECGETTRPIRTVLTVRDNEITVHNISIGETSERVN